MKSRSSGGGTGSLSCDAVRLAISAGLDGEPSDLPRTAVAAHMVRCADCRQFADDGRALQRRIGLQPTRQAPEALKAIVAAEWAETVDPLPPATRPGWATSRPSSWRRTARWAAALGPAAALVVVLPLGTLSAAEGTPTHASTPCTQNLHSPQFDAP